MAVKLSTYEITGSSARFGLAHGSNAFNLFQYLFFSGVWPCVCGAILIVTGLVDILGMLETNQFCKYFCSVLFSWIIFQLLFFHNWSLCCFTFSAWSMLVLISLHFLCFMTAWKLFLRQFLSSKYFFFSLYYLVSSSIWNSTSSSPPNVRHSTAPLHTRTRRARQKETDGSVQQHVTIANKHQINWMVISTSTVVAHLSSFWSHSVCFNGQLILVSFFLSFFLICCVKLTKNLNAIWL